MMTSIQVAAIEATALTSVAMAAASVASQNTKTSHVGAVDTPAKVECGSTAVQQVDKVLPSFTLHSAVEKDNKIGDLHILKNEPIMSKEITLVVPELTLNFNRKTLICRRFKHSGGITRSFNSLPLFVYATSTASHATSADGVRVGKGMATTAILKGMNDSDHLTLCTENMNCNGAMNGLALSSIVDTKSGATVHLQTMPTRNAMALDSAYQQNLNLQTHQQPLLAHHSKYSNSYHLHHHIGQEHVQIEQTKSLQELQHEVGALLEFRDLVIETFPDLKHKMASMCSASSAATAMFGGDIASGQMSGTNTLTGVKSVSGTSTVSRREWEPGIEMIRKISEKEPCASAATIIGSGIAGVVVSAVPIASELSSNCLPRSRSNSHSGKKEPKSAENNSGSVVQDSGFSTETNSSKDGQSASSTNGAMNPAIASNRIACSESDDELMNLLNVIQRKSSRLREEVERLQKYENQDLHAEEQNAANTADFPLTSLKSSSKGNSPEGDLTPQTFHDHFERINKEDIQQLRKDRDRLLQKLAEMEAETLTGRIKVAKMSDQIEKFQTIKKDLEEQLKMAMGQKLELNSRVQQLQQQQSKSSTGNQSDYSSNQRLMLLASAATVPKTDISRTTFESSLASSGPNQSSSVTTKRFYGRELDQQDHAVSSEGNNKIPSFNKSEINYAEQLYQPLGKLDGIVSSPDSRNSKCRATDSKRFQAILLETNVIELQRHLLTLTVQNQVLAQKLDQSTKSKTHLFQRLDRSQESVEDLKFQLEEKNIELEGTKAQLRVLESRLLSSTLSTASSCNHSQHDYEMNRSAGSTSLILNRRDEIHLSDSYHDNPMSSINILPAPSRTQISTPSMKAMSHLHLDEVEQDNTSNKSTQQLHLESPKAINMIMSASVGRASPFALKDSTKKLGHSSISNKPSKIPISGNKPGVYFPGKPPTGKPCVNGCSPTSHTSASSKTRSSLSQSTSNLIGSKSPNSLKRAESAQSIHKDASSLSTSRSSTSSIPVPTTPYSSRTLTANVILSPRVLQNSPVPKSKRARPLDSLSRIHQGQNISSACPNVDGSYLLASTPKSSNNSSQLKSSLRKDMQLCSSSFSHGSQKFLRRSTTANMSNTIGGITSSISSTRRFSSASVVGGRFTGGRLRDGDTFAKTASSGHSNPNSSTLSAHTVISEHNSADNDMGKVRTLKSTFLGWLKI